MTLTDHSGAIAARLTELGHTVAVAESAAGGLISASLLAVPGASAFFKAGAVVYTLESRKAFLELTRDDVDGLQPMTEAMAAVFARRARERLGTTWGIAELGIAGPTGARYGHPPGSCVIAIDGPKNVARTVSTGHNDREENMWAFTRNALELFASAIR